MAGKFLLFSFTILFLSLPSFSSPLHYQNLLITTLPSVPTVSWSESESESLDGSELHQLKAEPGTSDAEISLPLHHIDALSFNKTPNELFNLRLKRDSKRVASIAALAAVSRAGGTPRRNLTHAPHGSGGEGGGGFSSTVVSGLTQGSGEYFTRLGVGTPARYFYMVLDTGSDVVWLQCAPCKKCYKQSDPVFDPRKSRSFAGIPCESKLCHRLDSPGCNSRRNCLYEVSYGDESFTVGELSTETLTFRGARVNRVAIGCGHDNEGLFAGAAGLLGLGRGRLSFPSQTGRRFDRKFSYCLVDRSASSKPSWIIFGEKSVSRAAKFTPLISNPLLETFYYLDLIGISVGGTRVRGVTSSLFKFDAIGNGGVIIDSGTSVSRLTRSAYTAMRDAFRAGASGLKRAPEFSLFDTCYDLSGKKEVKVPTVVFHFKGADVSLPARNYLIPVDSKGRFCFAFAGTTSGLSIIGNIQQQGFRVVYDLAGSRVGFAPRGCA